MLTVHSPEPEFSGEVAGVRFTAGAATLNPQAPNARAALAYFRRCGYTVTNEAPAAPAPESPPPTDGFDPGEHNVVDVLAYLADADEDERARVLAAEAAGDARATILKKGNDQ
jgi:hypothetical protein